MKNLLLYTAIITLLSSCIGDDFIDDRVDPVLRITDEIQSLEVNTMYQFNFAYFNNIGAEESVNPSWSSSDSSIIIIDDNGLATAIALGEAIITAEYVDEEGNIIEDIVSIIVDTSTVIEVEESKSGVIATTTFYDLSGTFTIDSNDDDIIINVADDYEASTGLPGLYLYLSNNRNSIANAREIGKVEVFNGAHTYTVADAGLNDYSFLVYFCKPFNVKVGDGEIQ